MDQQGNLTQRSAVRNTKPGRIYDQKKPELCLATHKKKGGSRRKYWLMDAKLNGKRTSLSLGKLKTDGASDGLTLKEAREQVEQLKDKIERGIDPRKRVKENAHTQPDTPKRRDGAIPTFWELAKECHADFAPDKSEAYARQWLTVLQRNAKPILDMPVNEITAADVYNLLKKRRDIEGKSMVLWRDMNPTAKLVRMAISKTLGYAVIQGYIKQNPAAESLKGQLGKSRHRVQHHKSLHPDQVADSIKSVWDSSTTTQVKLCFSFIVLTACRTKEARLATWWELDRENNIWKIPAERMKSNREHLIPLSLQARYILQEAYKLVKRPMTDSLRRLDQVKPGPKPKVVIDCRPITHWFFPGEQHNNLGDQTLQKMIRRLGIDTDMHGYRASFKTWCSENRIDRELSELSLAHTYGSATEQAYNRTDLLEQRREVMQQWADYIAPPNK